MSESENHPGWGGPRPGFGGKQPGAGRIQQRITLTLETARLLRELTSRWRLAHPEAHYTPSTVVEDLIYREALTHPDA